MNNNGRIIAGKMIIGGSLSNNTGSLVFVFDKVSIFNPEYIKSLGVFDVGRLEIWDKKLAFLPTITDSLIIDGNIQTMALLIVLTRELKLHGKLVVLDGSAGLILATFIQFIGELAWVGKLNVMADKVEIADTSKFQLAPTRSENPKLDIVLDTKLLTNRGKIVVSNLTLTTSQMIVDNHGMIKAAIHTPVLLRQLINQQNALISVENATELSFSFSLFNKGTLEFKENTRLKVCEGEESTQNANGLWNPKIWFVGTVVAQKNLTLHTPVFTFLGTSKIDGTLNIVAEVGFFQRVNIVFTLYREVLKNICSLHKVQWLE